jgi:hypothetical protein
LEWLRDDNRARLSDGEDEYTPAIRNRAANGCPDRARMAALEFRLAKKLGGAAQPGWSPRKGRRLSPFLGASPVAIRLVVRRKDGSIGLRNGTTNSKLVGGT